MNNKEISAEEFSRVEELLLVETFPPAYVVEAQEREAAQAAEEGEEVRVWE